MTRIAQLLSTARLVTLTGPPGVGKTRLAVEVGRRVRRAFPAGVWMVPLAPLHDPALVAHTVANVLAADDGLGGDPVSQLIAALRQRAVLLVLDTCEHLAEACATLTHTLLSQVPQLRALATSRQALRISGEHVWPVAPLAVTPPHPPVDSYPDRRPSTVVPSPAAELFAERAAMVNPSFTVTADNGETLEEICRRLDGIPLAIELAAARTRSLSVEQLRARLDDRLQLLAAPDSRGRPPHQRTLEATIGWSYDLCDPAERSLWARASVFAGEFDLEAAEEVCAGGELPPTDVLPVLDRLVGKSILVYVHADEDHPTYRLLEILREYGRVRLRAAGDAERLTRLHADRYLRLAERAEQEWFGPDEVMWFRRLSRADADLRSALEYMVADGDASAAHRLAAALWFHWTFSGRATEGALWLTRVLDMPVPPTRDRVRALSAASVIACIQAELATAARWVHLAGEVADQVDDPSLAARVATHRGAVAMLGGDPRTEEFLADALGRYEALGESDTAVAVLGRLALATWQLVQGDLDRAADLCHQVIRTCRDRGDQVVLNNALGTLLHIDWRAGRADRALEHGREILRAWRSGARTTEFVHTVEMLAWIAAENAEFERAAILLGAAAKGWRTSGWRDFMTTTPYRGPHDECVARTRQALGRRGFDAAFDRGAGLLFDETVVIAMREAGPTGRPPAPRRPGSLTRRQREVAELVAAGLSNREIAAKLLISQRTAESHVENAMSRLGVTTRAQIAAWIAGPDGSVGDQR